MTEMNKLINKYSYNACDSKQLRLTKYLLLTISISCSFCGLVWSAFYYVCFGVTLTTVIPLVFTAIVAPAIFISHFTGKYKLLIRTQLTCIVLVPFLIQLSLGTISDSGFVISWAFLGPIGALMFLDHKSAKRWMLAFMLIVCFATVGFSPLSTDGEKVTENVRTIFYLMNIGAPSTIILFTFSYYLKNLDSQRKKNTLLLKAAELNNKQLTTSLDKEKKLVLLKNSFISTASHQFRTPLAVIQSNAELIEMFNKSSNKIEPEKYQKVTSRIAGAIDKMTVIMDDVLLLGKLSSGNVLYNPESLDVVLFCEQLAQEFGEIQLDGRGLAVEVDGEPYSIMIDTSLLTHSLSNLISNAFKYSLGKESPKLSIHFKPKKLVLSVKDYGIGIPKDEQLHLFQPFFRANNAIKIHGTGLGLSIAKEYCEINQGKIVAKSILGEGSCFEITFKK